MSNQDLMTMQRLSDSQRSRMMDRVLQTFIGFAAQFGFTYLYPSQIEIAEILLYSALTEQWDVYIKISRQYGKTEIVTLVLRFLIVFYRLFTGRPLKCGIASPNGEQSKTDIDRIKLTWGIMGTGYATEDKEFSGSTIRAFRFGELYAEVFKFSLGPMTSNESKTLNLLIIEEAHKIDDQKRSDEMDPMLASTNGPTWHLGVGNTKDCDFKKGCDGQFPDSKKFVIGFDKIVKERREAYEKTNDPWHLNYEKKVGKEISKKGRGNPEIRRNYLVEDTVESGTFITLQRLQTMARPARTLVPMDNLFFGIDWAKSGDHSWASVGNDYNDTVDWLKVPHGRWSGQCEIVKDWIMEPRKIWVPRRDKDGSIKPVLEEFTYFDRIMAVRGDSTGLGDMPMETLMDITGMPVDDQSHVVFSESSKHTIYTNWEDALFREEGDEYRYSYPADHELTPEFEYQTSRLLRAYTKRGGKEMLKVNHPDGQGERDDAPDTTCLHVYAAATGKIQEFL
jgi:hypothetical protein